MRDHRQGNDLAVVWSILRDGKPFNLSGKKLKLYLKNMYERREVEDFSARGNQIHWTFFGKDQKTTGRYSLILVGNENEEGMITVDTCDFVNLVSCSCKVQNSEDSPNVETETIELTSNLDYVAGTGSGEGGGSYDDTAIWEALNDKVDKVDGKGLSSNDFTDAYVEQLASLDDTYQPKGDYVETKNLATINGKPLNEGGDIKIEGGSGGGASIEVDDKLSTTSENPVQNKVITAELNKKAETGAIPTKLSQLTDNVGFAKQADVEAGYQPKGNYVTDDELSSKGYATEKYVDNAIEGVGEVSIDVDSFLSTTSENPVQNKVIYEALSTKLESEVVVSSSPTEEIPLGYDDTELRGMITELSAEVGDKQDTITDLETIRSGASKGATAIQEVKTINGQSIVGSGNLEIQGGGGGDSHWVLRETHTFDGVNGTITYSDLPMEFLALLDYNGTIDVAKKVTFQVGTPELMRAAYDFAASRQMHIGFHLTSDGVITNIISHSSEWNNKDAATPKILYSSIVLPQAFKLIVYANSIIPEGTTIKIYTR